ncbi:hypothetical protein L2E82_01252 [Cichorium intybus]|uniref:Uncharacterized protein n=1 Tax=Cichorium intybus TaxID=13427 RepID=A0ACB9GY14_CICIN|nr:hypothetical protein L2E82_01252 [Cichorium intybus]
MKRAGQYFTYNANNWGVDLPPKEKNEKSRANEDSEIKKRSRKVKDRRSDDDKCKRRRDRNWSDHSKRDVTQGHLAVGQELDLVELQDQLIHQVYKIDPAVGPKVESGEALEESSTGKIAFNFKHVLTPHGLFWENVSYDPLPILQCYHPSTLASANMLLYLANPCRGNSMRVAYWLHYSLLRNILQVVLIIALNSRPEVPQFSDMNNIHLGGQNVVDLMEIHNHVINPRSCEDRYLLLANNIAIQGHPAVGLELDLAELEDQLTHQVYKSDPEIALVFVDIFKMDPNFLENENNMPINFCQCQVGHKLLKIKLEPGQEEHHGKHHSYCFSSKFNPSQQSDSTRKGEPSMTKSTSVTVKRSESR